jgi:hypothetical protein
MTTEEMYDLFGLGLVLHAHKDTMYIVSPGQEHFHAVGEVCDASPSCPLEDEDLVALYRDIEPQLWVAWREYPPFAYCWDPDDATWHPEWVALDAAGRPSAAWTT